MSYRDNVFQYVKKKYHIEEDYPLPKAPLVPVMRHPDNRKWFLLIAEVSKAKLGLDSLGYTDVINLKMSDPLMADMLTEQDGYFRGYPINRGKWISILLDGTVPFQEICNWIDVSYSATSSSRQKMKLRDPKEWLVPANPRYYDIEHAFDAATEIDWKQGKGIKIGDTVFLYAAAPVSAVLYKCKVTDTDIPYDYHNEVLKISALMKLELIKKYGPNEFPFQKIKKEFGIFAVRGPRYVPDALSKELNQS